jgi:Zn-dependent peptidase ImmA (M78 family)
LALSLSDWIDARFTLPEASIPKYQGVDPETAAMTVRAEWGLGVRPIRNMVHLLESRGVRVFSLVEECTTVDAFSFWRGHIPCIWLNTMKSGERRRMDAAHELGHLVLHTRGGARKRDVEREADLFGSAFLMPRSDVLAVAPRGGTLAEILQAKHRWGVSAANLTHWMYVIGLLTEWQYRSLFIEMGRLGYRTGEPDGAQAESSQVLPKIFKALRDEGVTKGQIANDLAVFPDELNKAIFGLVLSPLESQTSSPSAYPERTQQQERPELRLLLP